MNEELMVPKFATEREEAKWWDENPDFALKVLERAEADGTLGNGSMARRKAAALRLNAADILLADRLAKRKGIEREAYLQELLHAALVREAESVDASSAA